MVIYRRYGGGTIDKGDRYAGNRLRTKLRLVEPVHTYLALVEVFHADAPPQTVVFICLDINLQPSLLDAAKDDARHLTRASTDRAAVFAVKHQDLGTHKPSHLSR